MIQKSGKYGVVPKDNFPANRRKDIPNPIKTGVRSRAGERWKVLYRYTLYKMNRRVEVEKPGPEVETTRKRSYVVREYGGRG